MKILKNNSSMHYQCIDERNKNTYLHDDCESGVAFMRQLVVSFLTGNLLAINCNKWA